MSKIHPQNGVFFGVKCHFVPIFDVFKIWVRKTPGLVCPKYQKFSIYTSHGQPKSVRGPNFSKKALSRAKVWDFYYTFSRLFCAIFRAFKKAALKSLKGRRLPMADLHRQFPGKLEMTEKNSRDIWYQQ